MGTSGVSEGPKGKKPTVIKVNRQKVEIDKAKGGIKLADMQDPKFKTIFEALDGKLKNVDENTIGSVDNMLDSEEIAIIFEDLVIVSGRNKRLGKKEFQQLINKYALTGITVEDLEKFYNRVILQGENVADSEIKEDEKGQRVVVTTDNQGNVETRNSDGSYRVEINTNDENRQVTQFYNTDNSRQKDIEVQGQITTTTVYKQQNKDASGQELQNEVVYIDDKENDEHTTVQFGENNIPTTATMVSNNGQVQEDYQYVNIQDASGAIFHQPVIVKRQEDIGLPSKAETIFEYGENGVRKETRTEATQTNRGGNKVTTKYIQGDKVLSIKIVDGEEGHQLTTIINNTDTGREEQITDQNDDSSLYNCYDKQIGDESGVLTFSQYSVGKDVLNEVKYKDGNTIIVRGFQESDARICKTFGITKEQLKEANGGKVPGTVGAEIVIPVELKANDKKLVGRDTKEVAIAKYKEYQRQLELERQRKEQERQARLAQQRAINAYNNQLKQLGVVSQKEKGRKFTIPTTWTSGNGLANTKIQKGSTVEVLGQINGGAYLVKDKSGNLGYLSADRKSWLSMRQANNLNTCYNKRPDNATESACHIKRNGKELTVVGNRTNSVTGERDRNGRYIVMDNNGNQYVLSGAMKDSKGNAVIKKNSQNQYYDLSDRVLLDEEVYLPGYDRMDAVQFNNMKLKDSGLKTRLTQNNNSNVYSYSKNGRVHYYQRDSKGNTVVLSDNTRSNFVKREAGAIGDQLYSASAHAGTDDVKFDAALKLIDSSEMLGLVENNLSSGSDSNGSARTYKYKAGKEGVGSTVIENLVNCESDHKERITRYNVLFDNGAFGNKEQTDATRARIFIHETPWANDNVGDMLTLMSGYITNPEARKIMESQQLGTTDPNDISNGVGFRNMLRQFGMSEREIDVCDAKWVENGAYEEAKYDRDLNGNLLYYKTDENGDFETDAFGQKILAYVETSDGKCLDVNGNELETRPFNGVKYCNNGGGDQNHRDQVIYNLCFRYDDDRQYLQAGLAACNSDVTSADYQYLSTNAAIANQNKSYNKQFANQNDVQVYIAGRNTENGFILIEQVANCNRNLYNGDTPMPASVLAEDAIYRARSGSYNEVFSPDKSINSDYYNEIKYLIDKGELKGCNNLTDVYNKAVESLSGSEHTENERIDLAACAMISGQVPFSDETKANFAIKMMHRIDENYGCNTGENKNIAQRQEELLKLLLQDNPQIISNVSDKMQTENFEYTYTINNPYATGMSESHTVPRNEDYKNLLNECNRFASKEEAVFKDADGNIIDDPEKIQEIIASNKAKIQAYRQSVAHLRNNLELGIDDEGDVDDFANLALEYYGFGVDRQDARTKYLAANSLLQTLEAAAEGRYKDGQGNIVSFDAYAEQTINKQYKKLEQAEVNHQKHLGYVKVAPVLVVVGGVTMGASALAEGWSLGSATPIVVPVASSVMAGTADWLLNKINATTSTAGDNIVKSEQRNASAINTGVITFVTMGMGRGLQVGSQLVDAEGNVIKTLSNAELRALQAGKEVVKNGTKYSLATGARVIDGEARVLSAMNSWATPQWLKSTAGTGFKVVNRGMGGVNEAVVNRVSKLTEEAPVWLQNTAKTGAVLTTETGAIVAESSAMNLSTKLIMDEDSGLESYLMVGAMHVIALPHRFKGNRAKNNGASTPPKSPSENGVSRTLSGATGRTPKPDGTTNPHTTNNPSRGSQGTRRPTGGKFEDTKHQKVIAELDQINSATSADDIFATYQDASAHSHRGQAHTYEAKIFEKAGIKKDANGRLRVAEDCPAADRARAQEIIDRINEANREKVQGILDESGQPLSIYDYGTLKEHLANNCNTTEEVQQFLHDVRKRLGMLNKDDKFIKQQNPSEEYKNFENQANRRYNELRGREATTDEIISDMQNSNNVLETEINSYLERGGLTIEDLQALRKQVEKYPNCQSKRNLLKKIDNKTKEIQSLPEKHNNTVTEESQHETPVKQEEDIPVKKGDATSTKVDEASEPVEEPKLVEEPKQGEKIKPEEEPNPNKGKTNNTIPKVGEKFTNGAEECTVTEVTQQGERVVIKYDVETRTFKGKRTETIYTDGSREVVDVIGDTERISLYKPGADKPYRKTRTWDSNWKEGYTDELGQQTLDQMAEGKEVPVQRKPDALDTKEGNIEGMTVKINDNGEMEITMNYEGQDIDNIPHIAIQKPGNKVIEIIGSGKFTAKPGETVYFRQNHGGRVAQRIKVPEAMERTNTPAKPNITELLEHQPKNLNDVLNAGGKIETIDGHKIIFGLDDGNTALIISCNDKGAVIGYEIFDRIGCSRECYLYNKKGYPEKVSQKVFDDINVKLMSKKNTGILSLYLKNPNKNLDIQLLLKHNEGKLPRFSEVSFEELNNLVRNSEDAKILNYLLAEKGLKLSVDPTSYLPFSVKRKYVYSSDDIIRILKSDKAKSYVLEKINSGTSFSKADLINFDKDLLFEPSSYKIETKRDLSHTIEDISISHDNGDPVSDWMLNSIYRKSPDFAKKIPPGEVANINGHMYVSDGNELIRLNLSKEKFEDLFPIEKRHKINQGGLGDCWLVTAIGALMDSPKGRVAIYRMFSQRGNDIIVRFPDVDIPIPFPNGEINWLSPISVYMNGNVPQIGFGNAQVSACKGVRMLERAYSVHRYDGYGDANIIDRDIQAIFFMNKQMHRLTGGYSPDAIESIVGEDKVYARYYSQNEEREIIAELETCFDNPNNIVTFSTKDSFRTNTKLDLASNHAYHVVAYDKQNGIITISNPWHNGKPRNIPVRDWLNYVSNFEVIELL